ncbi:MAG: hypothetical protein K1W26_11005 [Acetatifactor sp.]
MPSGKKNDKNALVIRSATEFKIEFPKNEILNADEQTKIQKAVNSGGKAIGTKTYIDSKKLQTLLNTDKKGVGLVLNDAPNEDIKRLGDVDYLSTPHVQKEIAKRREQPRPELDREKLKYSGQCIEAFSNNPQLDKERTVESDRINNERPKIGKKVIQERKSTVSELSGKPLDDTARVHHKNRVADKPEEALNRDNLTVIREDEHKDFHASDFPQNEEGYEKYRNTKYKRKK